ncbi:MAG TPA: ABC transporter permease [Candidatus Solibacter sp.]|nr:ABC transporter permease [Candidatus Solibacter sp.]
MNLRLAIRSLRKNAGFTVLAVVVLALGIGAITAIFTVINSVLLKPLGYREPDRIVRIGNYNPARNVQMGNFSAPDFDDLAQQNTVFEALSMYFPGGSSDSVIVGNTAEYALVLRVTSGFFESLGAQPALGRFFTAEESKAGAELAVISDAFWKRRFGGRANAIGSQLQDYGKVFTVVGITPPGFSYPAGADVWVPMWVRTSSRTAHNYTVVGRLKTGVTLSRAQTELDAIAARLEQTYPRDNTGKRFRVIELQDLLVRNIRTTLYLLVGAVALVLLIACANVANLLLARAASRTREVAVRSALGAGRWQIARQLMLESALIAVAGGTVGIAIAAWGIDALLALAPDGLLVATDIHIDATVLGFTMALSLAVSFLCGLAPLLQTGKVDLVGALKQGGTRGTLAGASSRVRSALVIGEVAVSIVLLIGAGLLMRSFATLAQTDWGFNPDKLLLMQATIGYNNLDGAKRVTRTYGEILKKIEGVHGVLSASAAFGVPGAYGSNGGYFLEGGPDYQQLGLARSPQADFVVVAPDYFRTLGVALRTGRDFNERDQFEADFVTIVNDALVKQSFPNENPIGKRLKCGLDSPNYMRIVGVVADTRQADPTLPPRAAIYMPFLQHPLYGANMRFVLRTQSEPLALSEPLRRGIREISSEIPTRFTTMDARLAGTVTSPRFRGVLLGVFAALAVCLAMAGVYGVMAYIVTQRTAEIGLRMALGAGRSVIVGLILSRGFQLAGAGVVIGLIGAFLASRLLETMLYGVTTLDPLTFIATALLAAVTTALACAIPAWRATRVDPMITLRQE